MSGKKALLCWEYGSGYGHLVRLSRLAERLRGDGLETVLLAPAKFSNISANFRDAFDEIENMPTARDLVPWMNTARGRLKSYDDVVESWGYGSRKRVFARLRLWLDVFQAHRPDLIVADYAPGVLMAARGRLPTVAIGNGYTLPPADLSHYPPFFSRQISDNARLLDEIAAGARLAGCAPVTAVPQVFRSDRPICETVPLLDPFDSVRKIPVVQPINRNWAGGERERRKRILVYINGTQTHLLRDAVGCAAATGATVFWHVSGAVPPDHVPEPGTRICRATRAIDLKHNGGRFSTVIHSGGHGMMLEALLSAVPQIVLTNDIEKLLHGTRLSKAGAGHIVRARPNDPDTFRTGIRDALAKPLNPAHLAQMSRQIAATIEPDRDPAQEAVRQLLI